MSSTLSRRIVDRKACLLDARVYVDGQPAIRCVIRDITPEGAKLVAGETIAARKILVFLPAIGEVWAALIRWRKGDAFGIQFIDGEADLASVANPSEPNAFAMRLQVAQVTVTARRLSKLDADDAREIRRSSEPCASRSPYQRE
jgi:hypothetical protein